MGGRAWSLLLVVFAVAGGCTPRGIVSPAVAPHGWVPTLLVVSAAADHVAVRVNGFRVGTVTRGRSCVRLPAISGSLRVELVSLSGRATAPEPLLLAPGAHWRLELGPDGRVARDILALASTEEGCLPGR